jgi:hypothetical protein
MLLALKARISALGDRWKILAILLFVGSFAFGTLASSGGISSAAETSTKKPSTKEISKQFSEQRTADQPTTKQPTTKQGPSTNESITYTYGRPGPVGTAYNYGDADYSNSYTNDGLLYWPRSLVYRAGSGTGWYSRPQYAYVFYYVYTVESTPRLYTYAYAKVNLGYNSYGFTPSTYAFVTNNGDFNGYRVKTYVQWRDSGTNTVIAARMFDQNAKSDYVCADFLNNDSQNNISCNVFPQDIETYPPYIGFARN